MRVAHPYLALMGLYLGSFSGMYSETALNIALPQLSEAFGIEVSLTQWLVVGYMLVIGIVLPFASLLMKWFPARGLTMFSLGAFLVGSLVSGFAPGFEIALAGRAIQGVGVGVVLPMMFATVMEVIPPHKIGSAMGISALVIMSATAIGPTLAGLILGAFSWRFIFFSFAFIALVGMAFVLKFGVSPFGVTRPYVDVASLVVSALGFGGIVFGVGVASLYGWVSAPVISSIVVGVACLAIYIRRQLGMDSPVLDLRAFSFGGFRTGVICMMLNFGITLSAMYLLPQFYQNAMLISVAFTGLVMLPGGVVNAAVSMLAGRIYDRIGARGPVVSGFALSIAGLAMLFLATPDETPLAYVMASHIIIMIGVPMAMSPSQSHALASLPHRLSTDGSTIMNALQQVFGAVCTAAATSLLTFGQQAFYANGGTGEIDAFVQGSHWGFAFAIALAVLGLLAGTRLSKRQLSETAGSETDEERNRSMGAVVESVAQTH